MVAAIFLTTEMRIKVCLRQMASQRQHTIVLEAKVQQPFKSEPATKLLVALPIIQGHL